ncbi:glycosyltransferase family 2 protein [Candidatus Woesearchaeota archaeon]|jgi:dolichyl-phosphate beta-glucosyltransferase|nr:glycosyltransferase family 2 protein [Candidatus Woesearchaeota archaeon]
MKISIVIPAYNEEKRIGNSLKKIIKFCNKNLTDYELIIVNDFSKDNTLEIINKNKNKKTKVLKNKKNKGKGYTVKRGILNAKYPLVLFSDSDLATPIEEILKMLKYIPKYDIIIASRNLKKSDVRVKQSWYRQIMGKTFPIIVNMLAVPGIRDTQCGFKLFKTDLAKKIVSKQTINRWAFDVELLFIARKMNLKIKEVPIIWIDKEGSTITNPLRDATKMLKDVIKIQLNNFKGKYD